MVAATEPASVCRRCGSDVSAQVLRPERFACIYCAWRDYGMWDKESWGEGRVLRLHYLGASPILMRLPPLTALMVPGGDTAAQSSLGLRIACPLCREMGVHRIMYERDRFQVRWRCRVRHELRLHRVGKEEVVGWS